MSCTYTALQITSKIIMAEKDSECCRRPLLSDAADPGERLVVGLYSAENVRTDCEDPLYSIQMSNCMNSWRIRVQQPFAVHFVAIKYVCFVLVNFLRMQ